MRPSRIVGLVIAGMETSADKPACCIPSRRDKRPRSQRNQQETAEDVTPVAERIWDQKPVGLLGELRRTKSARDPRDVDAWPMRPCYLASCCPCHRWMPVRGHKVRKRPAFPRSM
jgi:hypothetical protein